jgi:hypothetical protein
MFTTVQTVCGILRRRSRYFAAILVLMMPMTAIRMARYRTLSHVSLGENGGVAAFVSNAEPPKQALGTSASITIHFSGGKIVFQSSFMLTTVQLFFFASAISASLKVPIFDSAP